MQDTRYRIVVKMLFIRCKYNMNRNLLTKERLFLEDFLYFFAYRLKLFVRYIGFEQGMLRQCLGRKSGAVCFVVINIICKHTELVHWDPERPALHFMVV